MRIPPDVAGKLGYYVYLYAHPRTRRPFYVGKGKGSRALAHLTATGDSRKARTLRELRRARQEPLIEILAHGIRDSETALRVEAAVIDALGLERLTNRVSGQSVQLGRIPLRSLLVYYRAKPVTIRDPVLLIRINKRYYHGMTAQALYEATRGVWKLRLLRAKKAKYALAVFEGVVREVYGIKSWHPAGSTRYRSRPPASVRVPGRWEFRGTVAPEPIRRRYVDHSVRRYLRPGLQSPVLYRNC